MGFDLKTFKKHPTLGVLVFNTSSSILLDNLDISIHHPHQGGGACGQRSRAKPPKLRGGQGFEVFENQLFTVFFFCELWLWVICYTLKIFLDRGLENHLK